MAEVGGGGEEGWSTGGGCGGGGKGVEEALGGGFGVACQCHGGDEVKFGGFGFEESFGSLKLQSW